MHYRSRIAYIINGCSMLLAALFLLFYVFLIKFSPAIPGTMIYLFSTIFVFYLLKKKHFKLANFLIVFGFLMQETSIVFVLFPHEIHFNLYYFIVAPITFFIYDIEDPIERIGIYFFTGVAVLLFLVSEMGVYSPYAYQPTSEIVKLFKGISVFTSILSITIVFHIFTKELSKVHKELSQMANTDSLTRIYNRRFLFDLGDSQFHLANKYNRSFVMILLDIDYFKKINDTYGHPVGDSILVQLTDLIRSQIRKGDILSRYGGEEFAVLLKNTELEDGVHIAEKIRNSIEHHEFTTSSNEPLRVTISAGVVEYANDYSSFGEMVHDVDTALYEAKNSGRNCIVPAKDAKALAK